MALTVTHTFVSTKPASSNPSLVSSSQWNSNHTITGTLTLASPVYFRAASVQNLIEGETAVLGFSFAGDSAATPVIYDDSDGNGALYGVASFAQGNLVQDHFRIPTDWSGDTISLDIVWRSTATTGDVTWECQCGFLRSGSAPNLAFMNPASVTTNVPGSAYQTIVTTLAPLILTGGPGTIQAGDELFFILARSESDTATGPAELVSLQFNVNRSVSLS